MPEHQRYSPFPYTTLFRSYLEVVRDADRVQQRVHPGAGLRDAFVLVARIEADRAIAAQGRHGLVEHRDRKSTRLNSSHSSISYAVFCLKKKRSISGAWSSL